MCGQVASQSQIPIQSRHEKQNGAQEQDGIVAELGEEGDKEAWLKRRGGKEVPFSSDNSSFNNVLVKVRVAGETFSSPVSKRKVSKSNSVAQIISKFGGGNTCTSEGQLSSGILNIVNIVQEKQHTPKRKFIMLQDHSRISQPVITAQLSLQGISGSESPAKKFKSL